MRYIQGENRVQFTLFPETMDEYIADNNPIRFIDAFVNSLKGFLPYNNETEYSSEHS